MRDTLFKLKILIGFLSNAFSEWKSELWKRELDVPYCCGGRMQDECGCQGTTVREMYSHNFTKSKVQEGK